MSLIQQALEKTGRLSKGLEVSYPQAGAKLKKPIQPQSPPHTPDKNVLREESFKKKAKKHERELEKDLKKARRFPFDFHLNIPSLRINTKFLWVAGIVILISLVTVWIFLIAVSGSKISRPISTDSQADISQAEKQPKFSWFGLTRNKEQITSQFKLNGITSSGGKRLALINNRILAVGDSMGSGTTVKEIQNRSVILESQGREIVLTML